MKNLVLYTSDCILAKEELKKQKGKLLHRFGTEVLIVQVPDEFDTETLKLSSTSEPCNLSEESKSFVQAWSQIEDQKVANVEIEVAREHLEKCRDKIQEARERRSEYRSKQAHSKIPVLKNEIAIGIILVNGPKEYLVDFDTDEVQNTISQMIKAGQKLLNLGEAYDFSFVYNLTTVNVTDKPDWECSSYTKCELVFRGSVMDALGYENSSEGVEAYGKEVAQKSNADWGFAFFVVKYRLHHFAYEIANSIYMEYSNNGWGSKLISETAAHEICHVFGAGDEYGDCSCSSDGKFGILNYNCINCGGSPTGHEPCLMDVVTNEAMCRWTKGQVGWVDPIIRIQMRDKKRNQFYFLDFDGFNFSNLYQLNVEHPENVSSSIQVNDTMMYTFFQTGVYGQFTYMKTNLDTFVAGDFEHVPNTAGISYSPACILVKDEVYLFYQGNWKNHRFMYKKMSSSGEFSAEYPVPNTAGISFSPSAVMFDDKVYIMYQGPKNNHRFMYQVMDQKGSLSGELIVPDTAGLSGRPAITVANDVIHMFYRGVGKNNGQLIYRTTDGENWSGERVLFSGLAIDSYPSAVTLNGVPYCFFMASDSSILYYFKLDGSYLDTIQKSHKLPFSVRQGLDVATLSNPYGVQISHTDR